MVNYSPLNAQKTLRKSAPNSGWEAPERHANKRGVKPSTAFMLRIALVLATLVGVCGRRVPNQATLHLFTSTANQSSKYHLSMPNRVGGVGTPHTEESTVQLLRECIRLGRASGGFEEPSTVRVRVEAKARAQVVQSRMIP